MVVDVVRRAAGPQRRLEHRRLAVPGTEVQRARGRQCLGGRGRGHREDLSESAFRFSQDRPFTRVRARASTAFGRASGRERGPGQVPQEREDGEHHEQPDAERPTRRLPPARATRRRRPPSRPTTSQARRARTAGAGSSRTRRRRARSAGRCTRAASHIPGSSRRSARAPGRRRTTRRRAGPVPPASRTRRTSPAPRRPGPASDPGWAARRVPGSSRSSVLTGC